MLENYLSKVTAQDVDDSCIKLSIELASSAVREGPVALCNTFCQLIVANKRLEAQVRLLQNKLNVIVKQCKCTGLSKSANKSYLENCGPEKDARDSDVKSNFLTVVAEVHYNPETSDQDILQKESVDANSHDEDEIKLPFPFANCQCNVCKKLLLDPQARLYTFQGPISIGPGTRVVIDSREFAFSSNKVSKITYSSKVGGIEPPVTEEDEHLNNSSSKVDLNLCKSTSTTEVEVTVLYVGHERDTTIENGCFNPQSGGIVATFPDGAEHFVPYSQILYTVDSDIDSYSDVASHCSLSRRSSLASSCSFVLNTMAVNNIEPLKGTTTQLPHFGFHIGTVTESSISTHSPANAGISVNTDDLNIDDTMNKINNIEENLPIEKISCDVNVTFQENACQNCEHKRITEQITSMNVPTVKSASVSASKSNSLLQDNSPELCHNVASITPQLPSNFHSSVKVKTKRSNSVCLGAASDNNIFEDSGKHSYCDRKKSETVLPLTDIGSLKFFADILRRDCAATDSCESSDSAISVTYASSSCQDSVLCRTFDPRASNSPFLGSRFLDSCSETSTCSRTRTFGVPLVGDKLDANSISSRNRQVGFENAKSNVFNRALKVISRRQSYSDEASSYDNSSFV